MQLCTNVVLVFYCSFIYKICTWGTDNNEHGSQFERFLGIFNFMVPSFKISTFLYIYSCDWLLFLHVFDDIFTTVVWSINCRAWKVVYLPGNTSANFLANTRFLLTIIAKYTNFCVLIYQNWSKLTEKNISIEV